MSIALTNDGALYMQMPHMDWLYDKLKLKSTDRITDYFIVNESHKKIDKINHTIHISIKRITHLFVKGVWIDTAKIGRLINEQRFHPHRHHLSDEKIKHIIEQHLGNGFYEKSLQKAMEESPAESISNSFLFLAQFIKSPLTVGAILPSSTSLSKAITKDMSLTDHRVSQLGRRILEVGPGTGKFTREIIRHLLPADRLDLVEYDEKFCNILRKRFGHLPNVQIHHISITEFEPNDQYDYIYSGLPLNSFEYSFVEQVYDKFKKMIKHGGKLCYFEYMGLPKIKQAFVVGKESDNIKKVLEIKKMFFEGNHGKSERVWLNAPPARVCKCIYTTR